MGFWWRGIVRTRRCGWLGGRGPLENPRQSQMAAVEFACLALPRTSFGGFDAITISPNQSRSSMVSPLVSPLLAQFPLSIHTRGLRCAHGSERSVRRE